MSGNVNGQQISIPPLNTRGSELSGMLESGPMPQMIHHPNQYALANMIPTGSIHERDILLGHGLAMGPHLTGHMMPPHVPHPPSMPMGPGRGGNPYLPSPDAKLLEFNRRLLQRNDECDNIWWDSVISDYFEDDAMLAQTFIEDGPPKRYTIGRNLIPRYFRSLFESGSSDCLFFLRTARESVHGNFLMVDSEAGQMIMTFPRLMQPSMVVAEGRFVIEFLLDDNFRIRSWSFHVKNHREFVLRTIPNLNVGMSQEQAMRDLSNNITINGIPKTTLNFFRICNILEPMQELMSRQKAYSLNPKDCLKTTLFQKWQRMVAPPGQQQKSDTGRQSNKRRKRKGSNANSDSASNRSSKRKQSPVPSLPNINQHGDVMIVGEPTLMGGEFGDEDERSITRLENTQYDNATVSGVVVTGGGGGPNIPQPMMSHGRPSMLLTGGGMGGMPPGVTGTNTSTSGGHFISGSGGPPAEMMSVLSNTNSLNSSAPPTSATNTDLITKSVTSVPSLNGSLSNLIKSEPRLSNNSGPQYPGGCSTPGTTKTSGSLDQTSDDQSIRSSKTGPPRPTSQGGNQATEKSGDLISDHQRPISEPLPHISGPVVGTGGVGPADTVNMSGGGNGNQSSTTAIKTTPVSAASTVPGSGSAPTANATSVTVGGMESGRESATSNGL